MLKHIELTKSAVARLLEKEPFLLPDNLELEFKGSGYDLSQAVLTVKNGEKLMQFPFSKKVTIPKEMLFAGNLSMKITMYLGAEKLKEWSVLPIRIIETDTFVEGFDLLTDIENKVNKLLKEHEII